MSGKQNSKDKTDAQRTKSSTLHWSARTFASQRLSSAAQQTYLDGV
jgi:hypothetical protein